MLFRSPEEVFKYRQISQNPSESSNDFDNSILTVSKFLNLRPSEYLVTVHELPFDNGL